jgi:hypothetical protein
MAVGGCVRAQDASIDPRIRGVRSSLARCRQDSYRAACFGPNPVASARWMTVARIKRIHVNQHVIRANQRSGTRDAPLRVKTSRENTKAHEIVIDGPSRVVYRPDRPLSCGARVWIETTSGISVIEDNGSERRID